MVTAQTTRISYSYFTALNALLHNIELVKQIFSDVVDKLEEKEITKGKRVSVFCTVLDVCFFVRLYVCLSVCLFVSLSVGAITATPVFAVWTEVCYRFPTYRSLKPIYLLI